MKPNAMNNSNESAFTLVELLVVMAIILGLMLLAFPVMSALRGDRLSAGINTVSVAADAARRYATRKIEFHKDLIPSTPQEETSEDLGDGYSGTAILFTPDNQARIVENHQLARDSGDPLELMIPTRNGYRDVLGRNYISIPRGVGIVGVSRGGSGAGEVRLYTLPIAVRFDAKGHLLAAQNTGNDNSTPDFVFYDGNYDGDYENTDRRTGPSQPYDVGGYDPELTDPPFISGTNNTVNKYRVPFDKIRSVTGLIVFDKDALYDEGLDLVCSNTAQSLNSAAADWILENGEAIFFNRYTGSAIRDN